MPQTTPSRGNILYDFIISPSLTPVSVAAATSAEQSFTIPGLQVGDMIAGIAPPSLMTAGIGISYGRVSAANTLIISFVNATAGGVIPVAGSYLINVCRPESLPLPVNGA